jgi:predicted alpha/beta hydrolase family esterase
MNNQAKRVRLQRFYKKSIVCLMFILFLAAPNVFAENQETVVLLHGLGRTSASMYFLKTQLEDIGYKVVSESYASTDGSIKEHADWLNTIINNCCVESGKIHFVTHSLGGIILRLHLKVKQYPNIGRVVMLSPPNKGSQVADFLKDWDLFQFVMGPSGQEIGTSPDSIPNKLGPVKFELGVITGDVSFNPFTSLLIPGPDDGKVSVESAKVKGMKDFIVLPHSHTFIMNSQEVIDQVILFLETGNFSYSDKD